MIGIICVLRVICLKAFVKIYTLSYNPKSLISNLICNDLQRSIYICVNILHEYQSFNKLHMINTFLPSYFSIASDAIIII